MENQQTALTKSWVQVSNHSDFTIFNLPFGVFRNKRLSPRIGVAIGDKIVDLSELQEAGFFHDIKLEDGAFLQSSLNAFIALGKQTTKKVRDRVQQLLNEDNSDLRDHQSRGKIMVGLREAEMMMPVRIGNHTAIKSPSQDATTGNASKAFSPVGHLVPQAYQGRTSTILPSGQPFHRPKGYLKTAEGNQLELGVSGRLDFEMQWGVIIGKPNRMGDSIPVADAEDYIFGMVLFNDLTARDIQMAEAGVMAPFASKNFASIISPWVVTLDALQYFKTSATSTKDTLPNLQLKEMMSFDIQSEAFILPEKGTDAVFACRTNFRHGHWSASQLLAFQTLNGSNVEIGDLITCGAAADPGVGYYSSLQELSQGADIVLENGNKRDYLQDGETVIIRAFGEKDGKRVGFGDVSAKLLPTK